MIHAGQFTIMKTPTKLPGYTHTELDGGWILSHDPKLPLWQSGDGRALLLGYAWQVLPDHEDPQAELARLCAAYPQAMDEKALLAAEESWCGRYVLICEHRVYSDPCAMLSVFYSSQGISSSCALLAQQMGLEERIYHPKPGYLLNWMPGPLTHYPEISKLLPSRIYDYETGALSSRQLLAQTYQGIADDQARIRLFTEYFDVSLGNMRKLLPGKKFLVALTGGYDSRTLFALAKHANLDFDAFTLEYDGIFTDDISLPKELCQAAKIQHHYIARDHQRFSKQLETDYLRHTAGLVFDEDRIFYAHGQYQELIEQYGDVVFLRSSIWENVIEYFRRLFDGDCPGFDFYDWFGVEEGSREKESLEKYFAWHQSHPQKNLVGSNLFLWEQREGCWLSAIETGFDLLDGAISLQPVNCRLFLSMLMEFPREERLAKYHQARMIRYACPAVEKIPFGSDKPSNETVFTFLGAKLSRGVRRLRTLGIKKTWKTYISMIHKYQEKKSLERKYKK